MAGYEVSVGSELLPGLLNGQDGLAKLVETLLNQVLEAQVAETLRAGRHERTDERQGYRPLALQWTIWVEFNEWAANRKTPTDASKVIAING